MGRRRCVAVDKDDWLKVTVIEAEDGSAHGQWSGVGRWSRTSTASAWLAARQWGGVVLWHGSSKVAWSSRRW